MPAWPLSPAGLFLAIALPLGLAAFALCFRRASKVYAGLDQWLWAAGAAGLFLLFFALHWHYFPQSVDDSFISFRYSEHLAQGYGFVTNPGERVEGFSNPLWVVALAGLAKLGVNQHASDWALPLAAKVIGIVCNLATFWLSFFWATRKQKSWLPACVGLSWLVAAGANSFWSVTGMETASHALLLLWAALSWSDLGNDSRVPAHPVQLTFALLLLVISRPEGALFGVVLLGLWYASERRITRPWLTSAIGYAALMLVVEIFRLAYFGKLLPNTFYAKAAGGDLLFQMRHGLQYLAVALVATGGVLWIAALAKNWRDLRFAALPALILAQTVFVLYVGGDWMAGFRFWAPMIPLGVLGLIHVVRAHGERLQEWIGKAAAFRTTATLAALFVFVVLHALAFDRIVFAQNGYFVSGFRRLDLYPVAEYYETAKAVRANVEPGKLLTVGEAGLVPYYTSRARILDGHGLLDTTIAAKSGLVHMKTGAQDILARNPDYILLFTASLSPEASITGGGIRYELELAQSPQFRADYDPIYQNPRFTLFRRRTTAGWHLSSGEIPQ